MIEIANVVDLSSHPRRRRPGERTLTPADLRILLVEDDEIDARLFLWTARRLDICERQIVVAPDETRARDLLSRQRFDLCVVDFWLGPDDSAGLIADLGADPNAPPTLVLSNLAPEEMLEVYRPSDRLRILSKTQFGQDSLKEAVEALLGDPGKSRSHAFPALNGEHMFATLHEARSILSRIDGLIAVADTYMCSEDHEAAHSLLVSAGNQAGAAKAKLDALERALRIKYSDDS